MHPDARRITIPRIVFYPIQPDSIFQIDPPMPDLEKAQTYMREQAIDGWLLYDFRESNPVFWYLLGMKQQTTRRNYLFIPARGQARLLAHGLDKLLFEDVRVPVELYTSWQEMQDWLRQALDSCNRVAMEYSPGGAIPMHSWVDAGTVELMRGLGAEVVSSANLFQVAAASWSAEAVASHQRACTEVAETKDAAFDFIAQKLRAGEPVNEYEAQQFIRDQFAQRGMITDHGPIVAVNAHSGDPHFEPSADEHDPIQPGDWVLIDLWAKFPGDQDVFSDITWVGYVGETVPERHQQVYDIVAGARDAVVEGIQQAWRDGVTMQGWQADMLARDHIAEAGYGDYFVHRTGHSMGPGATVHALGVNLDNLETHDTREILPGVGFSVEPGIYLPEFGVRLEIDVYVDPNEGPVVTTPIQREVILIG